MRLTRRGALGAGLGLLAAPAAAQVARDVAPPASDAQTWSDYEARLRRRLGDAGGGRFDEDAARRLLDLTNSARRAVGAPGLGWHAELAQTAAAQAADLAHRGYFEHLSPEGFDPSHRFWLIGRTTIGSPSENIAYHRGGGPPASPARFLAVWRGSPGHWRNLLRPGHTHVGYGLVRRGARAWLVGLYARPVASLPEPLPFRAHGPEIARALRSLDSALHPRLAVPQGSRLGEVDGRPPVMQISALRPTGANGYDVVGGPIFLASDA